VLVTRPTEAALADAMRARELARAVETPLARIALNRAPCMDTSDIASALGAPVTRIPESAALARAQRHGLPVATVAPESPVSDHLATLASAVHSAVRS
jgi:septum site-determining protein MinD